MKYKIALIIVYFGELSNYYNLWFESAKKNRDIDFIVVTDNKKLMEEANDNVKIIFSSLLEVQKRAKSALKMQCELSTPYKLCDYKPAYGIMFSDLLRGYDFWGYCDMDVVWGDIRKFITDDLLEKYNRLFNLGHLTLYRNDYRTNRIFMKKFTGVHYTYKEAYSLDYNVGFDEKGCLAGLSENGNYIQYNNNEIIADIWPDTKRFRTFFTYLSDLNHVYSYENGKIFGFFVDGSKIITKEFMYIHLQKRKMAVYTKNSDAYLIIPNSFIDMKALSIEFINNCSQDRSALVSDTMYAKNNPPKRSELIRKLRRLIFAKILKIDQL